ncbi:hypothetical protein GTQ34_07905 [Muricauda sp. JGD-17]|uniref:Uncharacterized protein n=1 Tax=Flagellimonas ochracea TaxID=2696472 RepID=A0A964WXG4_9FLAO|nr:hypothetical protein [Allomuricauda ochracea]NAY91837.1 hypothetical protein [Allomuricauda ochracea]
MKPLILLLFILFGNSCSQEENSSPMETNSSRNSNEETLIEQGQLLGPNEALLKINILEASNQNKEICGLSKEYVFRIEVIEVLKIGGSVNHKLSKSEKMDVSFLFEPKDLLVNTVLEVKAREGLCPDTSSSYFTIIEHRILE